MDSSGIRANMSAQQLIDHEVYERSLRNPNSRQDGKVSIDSSGSSSLSTSNTKIDGKGIPSASDSSANSSSGENWRKPNSWPSPDQTTDNHSHHSLFCQLNQLHGQIYNSWYIVYHYLWFFVGFCLSSHLSEQNANPIINVVCDLFLVNLSSILIASFRLLACTCVSDVVVMWEWPVLEKFPSFHVLALIFSRSVTSDGVVLVLLPIGSQLTWDDPLYAPPQLWMPICDTRKQHLLLILFCFLHSIWALSRRLLVLMTICNFSMSSWAEIAAPLSKLPRPTYWHMFNR
jgi:hypothetical protein